VQTHKVVQISIFENGNLCDNLLLIHVSKSSVSKTVPLIILLIVSIAILNSFHTMYQYFRLMLLTMILKSIPHLVNFAFYIFGKFMVTYILS